MRQGSSHLVLHCTWRNMNDRQYANKSWRNFVICWMIPIVYACTIKWMYRNDKLFNEYYRITASLLFEIIIYFWFHYFSIRYPHFIITSKTSFTHILILNIIENECGHTWILKNLMQISIVWIVFCTSEKVVISLNCVWFCSAIIMQENKYKVNKTCA